MKLLITKMTFALLATASISVVSCEKPATSSEIEATTPVAQTDVAETPVKRGTEPIPVDVSKISFDPKKKQLQDKADQSELSTSLIQADGLSKSKDHPIAGTQSQELLKQVITITPSALDLGSFSTSEKGTGSVTLTNTGDTPVTLERAKASCGCTTSSFRPGTVLQPGETTEISVTMDGKGRARKMSKNVTFTIKDYPPIRLNVIAETVAFVTLDKDPITIDNDFGIDTITLTSIDDQPFIVTSIFPAIAVELPTVPATTQELKLDWKAFWDVVQTTKITIRLDHPLCGEITTNVRLSATQRQKLNDIIKLRREGGELPTKDPTRPLTGDQLAKYIEAGRGEQVLKYIRDGLGQYNAVNRGGVALLSIAAESGDAETTRGLLEMGALVERVDRVNRTPLMYAARSSNPETITILLEAGADIQARDRLGNTPLSWASGFGKESGVQTLVDAGADANTVDTVLGYSPLTWASGFGDTGSISILIDAGADVTVYDIAEGRTPLMHAVRTGKLKGVAALIDAGAKVNGVDNAKATALIIGADSNNVTLDKIELLIKSGANPNAKNSEGKTALDLAKFRTDDDGLAIVEYLTTVTKTE
jgi:ankyrin repeat protein